MAKEARKPRAMPHRPPMAPSSRASTRNCRRTSRAPTARRMPISRVRWLTESSRMFMMPMPPTMSETVAIETSRMVMVRLEREPFAELVEGDFFEAGEVAGDGVGDLGPHAAFGECLLAWVATVKSSGLLAEMLWRVRRRVVTSFETRVTSPVETVMSLSFERLSRCCMEVTGM